MVMSRVTWRVVMRALMVAVVRLASIEWIPGSTLSGRIMNIDILVEKNMQDSIFAIS